MAMMQTRRRFLTGLSGIGAAATLPFRRAAAIEPPPETGTDWRFLNEVKRELKA
jgi:hypothetical protein